MVLLVAGIVLFIAVHLIPVFSSFCSRIRQKLSPKIYQLVFSLLSLLSIVLIVQGLRSAAFVPVYSPPVWGHNAAVMLMLPALYLFFSTSMGPAPSSAKVLTAHPMSWGVIVWSVAHLLANGDLAHVLLFSAMGLYSVVSIVSGNNRGMTPKLTTRPVLSSELVFIGIVFVVYLALVFLHPYFTGMSLVSAA